MILKIAVRKYAPFVVIASILVLFAQCAKENNPAAPAKTREDLWKEDVDFLAQELPRRHKNLFFRLTQQEWTRQIDSLKESVAILSDQEVVLSMVKIVASVGDAHTTLVPTNLNDYKMFPLVVQWFSDGLYVTAVAPPYQGILSKRMTGVGSRTIDELYASVAQFISHENDSWVRSQSPHALTSAELLKFVRATDSLTTGRFVLEGVGAVSIASVPLTSQQSYVSVLDNLGSALPLYLWHMTTNYWTTAIDSSKVFYFQYNKCADMANQSLASFATTMFAYIDSHPDMKVIVDLRLNGGGNSGVLRPFIDGIKMRPAGNQTGKLFVLIGNNTFSSALLNAITLKNETHAILVGEPTGGKPNAYGEVLSFTLPYSKAAVGYTTKFFSTMPGDPPSLDPDILKRISFADFAAGIDPAVDYVRAY